MTANRLLSWLGVRAGKFHEWKKRYGKANENNGKVPRDHWLEEWEKRAIVAYHDANPLNGYRRLTFMMLDADVVAVAPTTVYRVLKQAGRLDRKAWSPSKKGKGFQQPDAPHRHWHVDISYVNLAGTFYHLICVLDGYSRSIVHWELRESMKELDIEIVVQRALEAFPDVKPRIISDNGPQFIARDFKHFVRERGLTHVRTSPYYPQSNGKLERFHGSIKTECIRPSCPENVEEARARIASYVSHYNTVRLHSAIGYVTPADMLTGRQQLIHDSRDRKLEAARARREEQRLRAREAAADGRNVPCQIATPVHVA